MFASVAAIIDALKICNMAELNSLIKFIEIVILPNARGKLNKHFSLLKKWQHCTEFAYENDLLTTRDRNTKKKRNASHQDNQNLAIRCNRILNISDYTCVCAPLSDQTGGHSNS